MTTSEIQADVGRYLSRYNFGEAPHLDQDIFQLGTVTSLVAMQILMFIEKRWSIKVPNSSLQRENFRSVNAIAALVEQCLPSVEAQ